MNQHEKARKEILEHSLQIRKAELEQQIANVLEAIRTLRVQIREPEKELHHIRCLLGGEGPLVSKKGGLQHNSFRGRLRQILKEADLPQTTRQICDELRKRNWNPKNVSTPLNVRVPNDLGRMEKVGNVIKTAGGWIIGETS